MNGSGSDFSGDNPANRLVLSNSMAMSSLAFTTGNASSPVLTISPDGKITLGEHATPDEGAKAVFEILEPMLMRSQAARAPRHPEWTEEMEQARLDLCHGLLAETDRTTTSPELRAKLFEAERGLTLMAHLLGAL